MTLPKSMGAIGRRKPKSFQNICGGREKVKEFFSKDGSVFACMQRKRQKTNGKLWEEREGFGKVFKRWQCVCMHAKKKTKDKMANFGKENKSWV
jgi:hypothetical protein